MPAYSIFQLFLQPKFNNNWKFGGSPTFSLFAFPL